jgi:hypothetical protein
MSWLDRLKSHQEPDGQATEPTKQASAGFVATDSRVSQILHPPVVPSRLRAALPANAETPPCTVDRECVDCLHLRRPGTCGEPVVAGLLTAEEGFGIVWPPEGHGAACPAFTGKMPRAAADRPHRLASEEADRCHAPCWDDAEIAAFTARTERFALLGRADADDLAERLTLRDRQHDNTRVSGRPSIGFRHEGTLRRMDGSRDRLAELDFRAPRLTSDRGSPQ